MATPTEILNKISKYLSLDLRSLAIMRICAGLMIISDIYIRSQSLLAHYTDEGVLPRKLVYEWWDPAYHLSLHLLSGELYFQIFLFVIAAIIGFLLVIGFKTRPITFIAWILLLSLHNRNPIVLQGGDIVFRLILFWGIFLPWGEYFSYDSLRSGKPKSKKKYTFSAGTFAFTLQLLLVYFFSAILKSGYEWHEGQTAVYYTLSLDQFTTPLGRYFLKFPEMLKPLTTITWHFEYYAPFAYLIPFKRGFFRTLLVFAFMGMHASFAATMHLGPFSYVMITAWTALLPTEFMDFVGAKLKQLAAHPRFKFSYLGQLQLNIANLISKYRKKTIVETSGEPPLFVDVWDALMPVRTMVYTLVVLLFLGTVLMWNARSVGWEVEMPINLDKMARYIRIDQHWNMFAPYPLKEDGWYVVVGEFRDGHTADLFQKRDGIDWSKPDYVAKTYQDQRWRKYLMNLWSRSNSSYRAYYLSYLCRYPTIEYDEKLDRITMYFVLETTLPEGKVSTPEPVLLQQIDCNSLP